MIFSRFLPKNRKNLKEAKQVIKDATDLIADPAHWTKHAYARDKNDVMVAIEAPDAVKFCLVGAIAKVTGQSIYDMQKGKFKLATDLIIQRYDALTLLNDYSTHEKLIKKLRRLTR